MPFLIGIFVKIITYAQANKSRKIFYIRYKSSISLTRSIDNRLARNFMMVSGATASSFSLSFCVAMLTQAHATIDGKNAENLNSEERRKTKRLLACILFVIAESTSGLF